LGSLQHCYLIPPSWILQTPAGFLAPTSKGEEGKGEGVRRDGKGRVKKKEMQGRAFPCFAFTI